MLRIILEKNKPGARREEIRRLKDPATLGNPSIDRFYIMRRILSIIEFRYRW